MRHPLYSILDKLDAAKIYYRLERHRDNTVMICATVVGSRIEIEVFDNGDIETSVFKGDESLDSGIEFVQKIIADNQN
jgi:hypothetical protein